MPQLGPMGAGLLEAVFNSAEIEAKVTRFHLAESARKLLAHCQAGRDAINVTRV